MDFEWDEAKRLANIDKHGIDFLKIRQIFDGRAVSEVPSSRGEEDRVITTGMVEDRFVSVVWVRRGDVIRIISARRSRDVEKRAYREIHG